MMKAIFIFAAVVIACSSAQKAPLPSLPSAFSTIVEANIVNKGYTTTIHEWVDEAQNAGRLDVYYVHEGVYGRSTTIYNYETSSYVHLNETGCVGGNLTDLPFSPFAGTPGHAGHIGSIANIFRFGPEFNETYMGTKTPHGINANVWESSVQSPAFNQSLRWYFTNNETWNMPEAEGKSVPLLLHLTGSRADFRNPTASPVEFDHHYEFVSFHKLNGGFLGSYNTTVFQLPCGTVCVGSDFTPPKYDCARQPCGVTPVLNPVAPTAAPTYAVPQGDNLPPLPESFSVIVQANIVNKNYTTTAHEYYSGPNKENKARLDQFFVRDGKFGRSSQIYDYSNNYLVHLEDNQCQAESLDNQRFLPFGGEPGTAGHIGTTAEIFEIGNSYNTTLVGEGHPRGIRCNMYRSENVITDAQHTSNMTLLWYFSSPVNWTMPSTAQNASVPVRLHLMGSRTNHSSGQTHKYEHVYDYFNFHFEEGATTRHGESVFAVPCNSSCIGDVTSSLPERECPVASCPIRPTLPQDFVTRLEGNDRTKNSSIYVEEYFSNTLNRARVDSSTVDEFGNFSRTTTIYDYTLNEVVTVNDTNCFGDKLSSQPLYFGGFTSEAGGRIGSVSELFQFGDEYDDVYIGTAYVRDIFCNQWRVTYVQPTWTLYMDHYFSVPEWDLPESAGNSVPVMTKVAGQYPQADGLLVDVNIEYHYVGFHVARLEWLDGRVFTVPCGTVCEGDNYKPLPERSCQDSGSTTTMNMESTTQPISTTITTSSDSVMPTTEPLEPTTAASSGGSTAEPTAPACTTEAPTKSPTKSGSKKYSLLELSGISVGAGILGLVLGFLIGRLHSYCKGRKKTRSYGLHENDDL